MGGYGYLFTLHPTENTGIGLGFTLMVTARSDILNNFPFPGALPLISVNYKDLMVMGAYVPGTDNVGNVLFILTKITQSHLICGLPWLHFCVSIQRP